MKRTIIGLAVVGLLLVFARVADARDLFQEAGEAYAKQRYEEAIQLYEDAARAGEHHAALAYNLGNAYFRAGKLGPAILAYERALRDDPDADDARHNLDVAREAVSARFGKDRLAGADEEPMWVRVATFIPLRVLAILVLLVDLVFFGVLIAVRFLPGGFLRTGLVAGNAFAGALGIVLAIMLVLQIRWIAGVDHAVVVADEVILREGPDPTRRALPTLHAGLRVVVTGQSQGWSRVRLANRVEGWVPEAAVGRL